VAVALRAEFLRGDETWGEDGRTVADAVLSERSVMDCRRAFSLLVFELGGRGDSDIVPLLV
jgi:hypothetical protein